MLSSRQLYERLNSLSRHQMDELISRLQSRGISIRAIRPYAYPDMPQAFHIFFLFDDSDEELDYFQLEPDVLEQIMQETGNTLRKTVLTIINLSQSIV